MDCIFNHERSDQARIEDGHKRPILVTTLGSYFANVIDSYILQGVYFVI